MPAIAPLTPDQIFQNVSAYYHPILKIILEEYIMPGEQVFLAADSTRHMLVDEEGINLFKVLLNESDVSTHKQVVDNYANLLIITTQRWIRWTLDRYKEDHSVRMRNDTDDGSLLFGSGLKYHWVIPPKVFDTAWFEKNKKSLKDYVIKNVQVAKLSEIKVQRRDEYTFSDDHTTPPTPLHLVRIKIDSDKFYTLRAEDGVLLHKLLQIASINDGKIQADPPPPAAQPDPVQRMQQLKTMLESGLISPQEYEQKKAQILASM